MAGPEPELMKVGSCIVADEAQDFSGQLLKPTAFGGYLFQPKQDWELEPGDVGFLRGTSKADSERQSLVYLVVGLFLSSISFVGFLAAIYMRLTTGSWWRDPIFIRSMPLPASIDPFVSVHGTVGMSWLFVMTAQLVSGAWPWGGSRKALRAVHRWLGRISAPLAICFFSTSGFTLLAGMIVEPIGVGYNSLFVRSLQGWSVFLSGVLYLFGIVQALQRNIAVHKDCMLGSIVFALVPVGVPRFGRDLLQWSVGPGCNVSSTPEFWFFWNSIYCVIGWPMVFVVARRFSSHPIFKGLLKFNIFCIICLIVMFRPELHLEPCIWDLLTGGHRREVVAVA